ncbi:MAG: hypothetical protein GW913_16170, partial [Myxococcales bacterium]|nr:hypothetical protein [Myxococcales bacterium]
MALSSLALLGALLLAGCPPTLSRPHSIEAERALATGDRHAHYGRVAEAVDAYRLAARLADRRVDRDEALYRLAQVFGHAGRYEGAVMVLDRIAARRPMSRRTVRALYDGSLLRLTKLHQREAGLAGLLRVATEYGDSGLAGRAFFHLLEAQRDAGDAQALAWLRQL